MLMEDFNQRSLDLRQVWIWGDIEDSLAHDVVQKLSYLSNINKQDIVILIHSDGGDIESAYAIIDEIEAIQKQKIKVWTMAMGTTYSAAAYILALGTKGYRFGRPNSTIMLHPCSVKLEDDYEKNQSLLMKYISTNTLKMNKKIAKACGKGNNFKEFAKDIDNGLWLTSKEAVDYGIIDGVWTKPIPIGGKNGYKEESD